MTYYLFDEYEIHYNEQPSGTTQDWHAHSKVWETLYIIEGESIAKWKENDEVKEQIVKTGDVIETENTPHTFTNKSNSTTKFLVIKQVLSGKNNRGVFKTDKVKDIDTRS